MTYLQINGMDLYAEVAGDGAPVLLLHGGFCSLESMRELSASLRTDHRVHAFERPGHGRSADIDGDYSYARGLADTIAYLDSQNLGAVHVIGYSDGAILGLLLAMEQPDRVRSLTAISANLDPSAFSTAEEHQSLLLTPARRDSTPAADAATDAGSLPAAKPDVERLHYERLSPDGPKHADVVLDKLFRLWTTEPNIDPADLARITVPVLIMAGDRDSIRPDHALLVAASIPGAQLCIVPGASHGLLAEHPELISSVIRRFLHSSAVRQMRA
ncbi:alpha/beta fold hydrolase [Arthrobacter sp. 08Y14]|uniref:alpha/beta fold hydrolase n=1 Tax=Arthrobacter sp. 08Y14 TaxID=2058885 RepID=UPI000CE2F4E2|nr:alpha/beta hydrolase [Arthrobacter sp. 08Y14]